jgi:hypothetical protein
MLNQHKSHACGGRHILKQLCEGLKAARGRADTCNQKLIILSGLFRNGWVLLSFISMVSGSRFQLYFFLSDSAEELLLIASQKPPPGIV